MPDGQQWKDFRENHKMAADRYQRPVSGSNASPPADHCDHRGSAKRLESLP